MTPTTARLIVVATSLIGGTAYLAVQRVLEELGPLSISSLRFLVGGLLLFVVARLWKAPFSRELITSAVTPGVMFGIAMSCMVMGLKDSLSTVAAFLVCSDAFFIPIIDRLLFSRKTNRITVMCLGIGAVGLGLLTLRNGFHIAASDGWLIVAAIFWAAYYSTLGHVVRHYHPVSMSCAAHLIAGVLVGAICFFIEPRPASLSLGTIFGVLYLAGIISALRFTLKARVQQVLLAAEMGLIFLIEPIAAAAFGVLFAQESLGVTQWIGAVLVLAAVAIPSIFRLRRIRRISSLT